MTAKNRAETSHDLANQCWQLRLDNDISFGPITLNQLTEWAEQGRIAPGYLISNNKKDWRPAEELLELRMEWIVELIDGAAFGPLNIHALEDLFRDGTVAEDAKLRNIKTGETTTVAEKCSAALEDAGTIGDLFKRPKRQQELKKQSGKVESLTDSSYVPFAIEVDRGIAPPEIIADILSDISYIYRCMGGSGINFRQDMTFIRERERA